MYDQYHQWSQGHFSLRPLLYTLVPVVFIENIVLKDRLIDGEYVGKIYFCLK